MQPFAAAAISLAPLFPAGSGTETCITVIYSLLAHLQCLTPTTPTTHHWRRLLPRVSAVEQTVQLSPLRAVELLPLPLAAAPLPRRLARRHEAPRPLLVAPVVAHGRWPRCHLTLARAAGAALGRHAPPGALPHEGARHLRPPPHATPRLLLDAPITARGWSSLPLGSLVAAALAPSERLRAPPRPATSNPGAPSLTWLPQTGQILMNPTPL